MSNLLNDEQLFVASIASTTTARQISRLVMVCFKPMLEELFCE